MGIPVFHEALIQIYYWVFDAKFAKT